MRRTDNYLKCGCCGHVVSRRAFTRGALGHATQALKKTMVGKGNGPGGSGIVWDRTPMQRDDLEHMARAIAKAADTVTRLLDEDITIVAPESVLATIDDDAELDEVTESWIEEARKELEYRLKTVDDEYNRRGDRRGR